MSADDARAFGLLVQEFIHLGNGAVEGGDGKTMVVHVEDQVLAHHGQPNDGDIGFGFHIGRIRAEGVGF